MTVGIFGIALSGFISGVALGSVLNFGWAMPAFFCLIGFAILLVKKRSTFVFLISIFLISTSLGLARIELENYRYTDDLYDIENTRVTIRGIVDDYPDAREGSVRFVVVPEDITSINGDVDSNEKILVVSALFPKLRYGDEILIKGMLRPIKNFAKDSTGNTFDYKKHMAKVGIFHEITLPEVSVISSGNGNKVVSALFTVREKFSDKIRENIREPEASLSLGMLLGEKHGFSAELTDMFKRAGIVHIVVLSGYNIALVSQFFMKISFFLPMVYRALFGGTAIILFVIMTGGGASVIRAALMALIALLGMATGRTNDSGRALFIAGALMLMENPNILLFDASFELSFLATLGLIYLSPVIFDKLGKWRPVALRELVSQTVATQIAVLPLLVYLSGMISVVSLPVNILVLPASPFQMFGSFVTGIFGFFGQIITVPFALITSFLLSHTIATAEFFVSLPFATVSLGRTGLFVILCVYLISAFIFWKRKSAA